MLLKGMCTGTSINGLHTVLALFPGRGIFRVRPLNSEPRWEPWHCSGVIFHPALSHLELAWETNRPASLESLIFVSNVYTPSALSVLCVHGVLILIWACVGLGSQAGGASGLCLAGPLLLGGSSALEASGRFEGRVVCQLWLAKDSRIFVSVTDHCRVPGKQEPPGMIQSTIARHLPATP